MSMQFVQNPGAEARLRKLAPQWVEGMTQLDGVLLGWKEYNRKVELSQPFDPKDLSRGGFDLTEPVFLTKLLAGVVQWQTLKQQGKELLPIPVYQALLENRLKYIPNFKNIGCNTLALSFKCKAVEGLESLRPGDVVLGIEKTKENAKYLNGVEVFQDQDLIANLLLDLSNEEWLQLLSQTLGEGRPDFFTMTGMGYQLQFQVRKGRLVVLNPEMEQRNYYSINGVGVSPVEAWGNVLLQLNRVMLTRDTFGGKIRSGLSNFAVQQQCYGLKSSLNIQKEKDTPGILVAKLVFHPTFGLYLEFENGKDVVNEVKRAFDNNEPCLFQHQGKAAYRGDIARASLASLVEISIDNKPVKVLIKGRPVDKVTKGPNRDSLLYRTGTAGTVEMNCDDR